MAIATSTYDSGLEDLPGVREEVKAFEKWLCDPSLENRRFTPQYETLRNNPTEDQIRAALRNPDPSVVWDEGDAAVLLVTGHGDTDGLSHWLMLHDTDPQRLDATGLRTAQLLGWLRDTKIERLLVILDVCFAGGVVRELLDSEKDFPATWLILPSATRHQEAAVGAFSRAVTALLSELGGDVGAKFGLEQAYLTVDAFVDEINRRLPDQRAVAIYGSQTSGPHVCLPNPHYRPREQTSLPAADLEAHWGPRSRGATRSDEPGWLFSGRAELMTRLIAAATGAPGTLLVTGRAGSGKSPALAGWSRSAMRHSAPCMRSTCGRSLTTCGHHWLPSTPPSSPPARTQPTSWPNSVALSEPSLRRKTLRSRRVRPYGRSGSARPADDR